MYFEDEKDIIDNENLHIEDDGTVSWEDILSDSEDADLDFDEPNEAQGAGAAQKNDTRSFEGGDIIEEDDGMSDIEYEDAPVGDSEDAISSEALQSVNNDESYSQEENFTDDFDIDKQLEQVSFDETPADNGEFQMPAREKKKQGTSPILIALCVALLVVAGCYWFFTNQAPNEDLVQPSTKTEMDNMTQEQLEQRANEVKEDEEANAPIPVVNDDNVDSLKAEEELKPEKKQVISIIPTGRINPFLPLQKYQRLDVSETIVQYDKSGIPVPPRKMPAMNVEAKKMLTISVSGIMYDNVKPSAIITLDNNDYFVQKGDKLDNYKVIDIGRNFVTVASGKNLYKANVGEEFKITSNFYGSAQYIPQGQGGGRQYYSVNADNTGKAPKKDALPNISNAVETYNTNYGKGNEYVSEDDVIINKK